MFKKGDVVVMHTCGEAKHYHGQLWTGRSDEFTSTSLSQVVFLKVLAVIFLQNICKKLIWLAKH